MRANSKNLLTIIPKDYLTAYLSASSEFHEWLILQSIVRKNEYREDDIAEVIDYYKPIDNDQTFLEIQLKLFLIKNSIYKYNPTQDLPGLILEWRQAVLERFNSSIFSVVKNLLDSFDAKKSKKYGKYFYSFNEYQDFVEMWNNKSVTLKQWKKYKYLNIEADFEFLRPVFEKRQEILSFPHEHMRKLFFEYSDEVYNIYIKSRSENNIYAVRDNNMINRLLEGNVTELELKNINSLFFQNSDLKIDIESLSRYISNKYHTRDLDIHFSSSMSVCSALMKYYENIQESLNNLKTNTKNKKEIKENYALWLTKMPKGHENKEIVYDHLKTVYDQIQFNCKENTWSDFKSIFNKNGSSVKIYWEGEASMLNYIFRKLNRELSFSGNKWEVVSHYFKRLDKNDDTLDPNKLINNGHFDDNKNHSLTKQLEKLILSLNDKT